MSQARLRAIAESLLSGAERVAWLGRALPSNSDWRSYASVAEAAAASTSFEGLVWQPREPLRQALRQLDKAVSGRGKLLVYLELKPGPMASFRALLQRRKAAPPSLEEVCEELLMCGYREPTVHAVDKQGLLVIATKPEHDNLSDAFTAQPSAT